MLSRSIAIIVCLSLIGVTVLPASMIPCCCASKGDLCKTASAGPRSCCAKGPSDLAVSQGTAKSCCANISADLPACCSKQTVKKECPVCRCIEQMQIVALSGYSIDQSTIRIPLVLIADLPLGSDHASPQEWWYGN
jgi:hypothetical protein